MERLSSSLKVDVSVSQDFQSHTSFFGTIQIILKIMVNILLPICLTVLGIVPECGMSFQIFLWSLIGITYKSPSHPSHLSYRYNILFHIKKKKKEKEQSGREKSRVSF